MLRFDLPSYPTVYADTSHLRLKKEVYKYLTVTRAVERLADLRTGSACVFILPNAGDNYKRGNRMPKRKAAPPASKVRGVLPRFRGRLS
jgi:hypothetical protein